MGVTNPFAPHKNGLNMLFPNVLHVPTFCILKRDQSEMCDKCLQNSVLFLTCRSMHLQCIQQIQMRVHLHCPSNFTSFNNQCKDAKDTYKAALEYTADVTVANTRFQCCRKHFKLADMTLQGSSSLS